MNYKCRKPDHASVGRQSGIQDSGLFSSLCHWYHLSCPAEPVLTLFPLNH